MPFGGLAINKSGGFFISGICWNICKMADIFFINIFINLGLAFCVKDEKKHQP